MSSITINGNSLDISSRPMLVSTSELATIDSVELAPDASHTRYILIKSEHALKDEEKRDLAKSGVEIQSYVDTNTYVCIYDHDDLETLRQEKGYLIYVDAYHNLFKIHVELKQERLLEVEKSSDEDEDEGAAGAPPAGVPPGDDTIPIVIGLHNKPIPTAETIVQDLISKKIISREKTTIYPGRIDTVISRTNLSALETIDSVESVELKEEQELEGNMARTVLNLPVVTRPAPAFNTEARCDGSGQTIHIADGAFDADVVNNVHPCFLPAGGRNRVLGLLNPTLAYVAPPAISDDRGHGTHVAGCALGNAQSPTMGGVSATIAGPVQGSAPAAQLVTTRLRDATGDMWNGNVSNLLDVPYGPPYNARISSHSYGPNKKPKTTQTAYGRISREYDDYIFQKNDLLVCWSAGNSGASTTLTSQVSGRSCCKNTLTVGATLNARKITNKSYDPTPAAADGDIRAVASYSSRGPTKEGRRKPDVCAPGTAILSALSRTKTYAPGQRPPPDKRGPSTDTNLYFNTGTSMAAPLVAGCAAVLRQALISRGVLTPSAALLKVLIIHGAVDMFRDVDPAVQRNPENLQGFGRVNMGGTMYCVEADAQDDGPNKVGGFIDAPNVAKQAPALAQGATKNLRIQPSPAVRPRRLTVTLTWMDWGAKQLVNALGLAVTLPSGERRHGNMGTGDKRATPRVYDDNNVQQVVWENIPDGEINVTVECVRAFMIGEVVKYALAWSLE